MFSACSSPMECAPAVHVLQTGVYPHMGSTSGLWRRIQFGSRPAPPQGPGLPRHGAARGSMGRPRSRASSGRSLWSGGKTGYPVQGGTCPGARFRGRMGCNTSPEGYPVPSGSREQVLVDPSHSSSSIVEGFPFPGKRGSNAGPAPSRVPGCSPGRSPGPPKVFCLVPGQQPGRTLPDPHCQTLSEIMIQEKSWGRFWVGQGDSWGKYALGGREDVITA